VRYLEKCEQIVRAQWFPDHVAKSIPQGSPAGVEVIRWKKPDTSIYSITYTLHGYHLYVVGDVGAAVYRFGQPMELANFTDMYPDYFASKCVASEHGIGYESWNNDEAKKYLEEWAASGDDKIECDERYTMLEGRNESYTSNAFDSIGTRGDWQEWLQHDGDEVFGDSWFDLGEIGMVVDIRCVGHLVGLKMAHAQLTAELVKAD
jgi:hypothetical protein